MCMAWSIRIPRLVLRKVKHGGDSCVLESGCFLLGKYSITKTAFCDVIFIQKMSPTHARVLIDRGVLSVSFSGSIASKVACYSMADGDSAQCCLCNKIWCTQVPCSELQQVSFYQLQCQTWAQVEKPSYSLASTCRACMHACMHAAAAAAALAAAAAAAAAGSNH